MKQLYSLKTLTLALTLTATTGFAQSYTGGTYTTVMPGDWTGNIWATVPPPAECNNCLIVIGDGNAVNMNTTLTLKGNSLLSIGTAGSGLTTKLTFPFSGSTATVHNRLNIIYGDPVTITLGSSNASIDATTTGPNDGVFLAVPTPTGNDPYFYIARLGTTANYPNPTTLSGPNSLSSIGTLPIILSDFNASLDNGSVTLSWTTALEINSDHFAVERSTDAGAHWSTIGTVAAHGNSSLPLSYSFNDGNPAAGTAEYRLQLVDLDGKYDYSQVRAVRNGLITSVGVYPNPARDYVNVTLAAGSLQGQGAIVRLINQSGQLLQERTVTNASGTTVALSVGSYPQGNYLIVVVGADGSKQVSKLLISK
ncbi:MAG: T9SS type A sorting domain-containing protein [Bacteroidetes bacterium]|nr:T9SS type A sorting domain-containing protein [Bacteroidota bacterium]